MFGGPVLIPARSLALATVSSSRRVEMRVGPRGTARTISPRSAWVMTIPGLGRGQSIPTSLAWHNSCYPVRQQFLDPLRRMGADSIEHIANASLRVGHFD
jgi:hypothetical protein